jgi:tRNA G46 methylase TrmB
MVNLQFPELAAQALATGGIVHLRTDHREYFEQMQEVFAGSAAFRAVETPIELSALLTDFEEEFARKGLQTFRAAYQRST